MQTILGQGARYAGVSCEKLQEATGTGVEPQEHEADRIGSSHPA